MKYFAFQRGPNGLVPVAFDERPDKAWSMCSNVIWETVREIPEELRHASLDALAVWASVFHVE